MSGEGGRFRPAMPFHMVWLATDRCNARCAHCSSNSSVRSPDELGTAEACDLVEQLADAGVVDLAISGGEPLLRRDLFEVIEHARGHGLAVGVGSNGALLREETARRLAASGVNRFQVSLDGLAESHDALRRWQGLFERAVRSVQLAQRAGLRTHVCCTINRLNWQTLTELTEYVAGLGVARLNFSRYVPTGRGTDALDLRPDEWRAAIELCQELRERYSGRLEIVTHLAQQILVDGGVRDLPGFIGCQAGVGQGAVTSNGTLLPCVLLPIPIGNIRQRPFRELWEKSPVIRDLQDRDRLEGRCTDCRVRACCGGCRAVSFAKTGRLMAEDPRCWHRPEEILAVAACEAQ